ncbi:lipase family protein [Nocardia sp. NPDC058176]|uniref:lipase family protein n=1 Tax=Nocardia sp. NPDC058176 TaxID=3346368 RepID=UPI0036DB3F29
MASSKRISRGLAGLAAGITAVTLCATLPAAAAPVADPVVVQPAPAIPLPPELDPDFYRPPAEAVTGKAPGEIIAARQVNVANLGLIPINVDAWQLSYRSNNSRDEPIAAVATVLKPRGSAPDKVLSLQAASDSLAGYCAPSYVVQQWSVASLAGQVVTPAELIVAQGAVAQGWGVVIPDHQGPNEAFAAGPLAGRITLDGIRAAQRFDPMRVSPTARIALFGYSGGAIATGHAAELKQSYAPELNIVGAAEGGVPADLGAVLAVGNGQLWSGMIMAAVLGLTREYPEFADLLNRDLDPLGQGLSAVKGLLCVAPNTALFPFLNIKGLLRVPGDPLQHPVVLDVVDRTRMGKSVPDMPMFIWQANPDELIPVGPVNTLVDTYCQSPDAQVRYTREHLGEHITTQLSGVATAMLWIRDRFDGVPAEPGCRTDDAALMLLNPEGLGLLAATLGETTAGLFGKALGAS